MDIDSTIRICKICHTTSENDTPFKGKTKCMKCYKERIYITNKLNRLANKERYNTYQKEYQKSYYNIIKDKQLAVKNSHRVFEKLCMIEA
jgi:hypothetical protein